MPVTIPVNIARVLASGYFDKAAVLFILFTVVHQQKCLGRIVQQWRYQITQLTDRQVNIEKEPVHLVVTCVRQVRGQVGAGVFARGAEQVINVCSLSQHKTSV